MSEREYDILLAETAGSLPPGPSEQSEPWRVAMRRILWGLALVTIKLELLGLNYLLPCLGAALVYLGFRSLRQSAPGFRLGWLVSIVLLVSAAASAVLAAARPVQSPDWLHWPLVALNFARDMCLLLGLRAGIRAAFERTEGAKPRDLALWAAAAYAVLFIFAIIWTCVPARSAVYSNIRGLAGLALYILLLLLLRRQGRELAGRGYRIEPAPVRLSVGAFLALYAVAIVLLLVPALLLGPRPAMPEAEPFSAADTEARESLEELGLPEWLTGSLTQEELSLCEGALWAKDCGIETRGDTALDGGQLEMEVWAVGLADGRSRFYAAFRWLEPPRLRLQEALGLEPDPNAAISEVSGALVYEKGGDTLAAPLPVVLGGGQTAEELDDMGLFWYEFDLENLGHVQYVPRSDFTLPFGAEDIRGWLAFTYDGGIENAGKGLVFGSAWLLHRSLPVYPYRELSSGGMFGGVDGEFYAVHYLL